ncbi:TetR family transcriptional regulator [Microtetraspora sp. NBRC 13810]|uniref:TetR/AcrR family transcriptional regulator n=1 Tax=Microtetraspora sp. NBRC 13810 TaxID=3030990 RepID=UPI0024A29C39|nr:TetR/AcrR family transcriptional regulator [Microtetraspora sp. NBRC 13810]GLW10898.1 TetR family transcriptional regulator [Microtetraspora sp. NBRC 13810]
MRKTADPRADRRRRAERILDAAGELLVSWGYRRVTVDEVARRAGVGKGTVYLHFETKEALFLTVLMRSQLALAERFLDDIRRDPEAVLLSRIVATAFRWVHEDPILRAVLIGDTETLGTLSRSAPDVAGDILDERWRVVDAYLDVLREHGLVRADESREAQRHALGAIITGYLTADALMPPGGPDVEGRAAMLAHVVRAAFETPGDRAAVHTVVPRVVALYQHMLDRLRQEIGRRDLS